MPLLDALDALKAAEIEDRVRQAAETIYQALIEAAPTAMIGAGPFQRTEQRTAQRNGHRPRTLTTTVGGLRAFLAEKANDARGGTGVRERGHRQGAGCEQPFDQGADRPRRTGLAAVAFALLEVAQAIRDAAQTDER